MKKIIILIVDLVYLVLENLRSEQMTEVVYTFFRKIRVVDFFRRVQQHMDMGMVRLVMKRPVPAHRRERYMMFLCDTVDVRADHALPTLRGIVS